jgi:hypothetical protein
MDHTAYRFGRRAFVLGTAALAASTRLPAFASPAQPPRLFLCDRRHLDCLTMADRAAPLALFDGDLTKLWVEKVLPLWNEGPAVIAGMSNPAALFCLEQLARGERHRLVARTALTGSGAVRFRFAPVGKGALV